MCDHREILEAATSTTSSKAVILRKPLGLRDLVLAQILAVVGNTWVGIAAPLGKSQSLTWSAAMLLFYVPLGALVIYLNRHTPLEGGIYKWAREGFGDSLAFMVAWNVWFYALLYIASMLFSLPTELAYMVGPSASWLPESKYASPVIVISVLSAIAATAVVGLKVGKWVHNLGSLALLGVYLVLILLPIWAFSHAVPVHWTVLSLHFPQRTTYNMALFGQMLFGALSGLEYVAILAGESKSPIKAIGRSVILASPFICVMFILGTGSVAAFVGDNRVDFIAPIPQTLRLALGHEGIGNVLAAGAILLLELRLLGVSSLLFTGVTRLPLTAGWDHLLPVWFTKLHPHWQTPTNSIFTAFGLVLALLIVGNVGVHAQEGFQVLINASSAHYSLAYMVMFAIPIAGASAVRNALPAWLKWTSIVGFCATLFSFIISSYPFVDVANPLGYAMKVIGTTFASNVLGYCFYVCQRNAATRTGHIFNAS